MPPIILFSAILDFFANLYLKKQVDQINELKKKIKYL